MSNPTIFFEGPALITLEGNAVFSLVARERDRAIFQVIGFDKEVLIRVIDYRIEGLNAIDFVIQNEDDSRFAKHFCHPAQVHIAEENTEITISLFDLNLAIYPELMLWITTGIEEPIPDYEYSFLRITQMTEATFGLVAVFNYQHFQSYFDGVVSPILAENQS